MNWVVRIILFALSVAVITVTDGSKRDETVVLGSDNISVRGATTLKDAQAQHSFSTVILGGETAREAKKGEGGIPKRLRAFRFASCQTRVLPLRVRRVLIPPEQGR